MLLRHELDARLPLVQLVCPETTGTLPAEVPGWFETNGAVEVDPMHPNVLAGAFSSQGHDYAWHFERVGP